MTYSIKTDAKGLSFYDRQGRHRATVSDQSTKIDSATVKINVSDPARVTLGDWQVNPLGNKVASTVVSPQPTLLPMLPQINIAMTMIFAIVAIANQVSDELEDEAFSAANGRPIRRTDYQIVNFEDFLPESAAG